MRPRKSDKHCEACKRQRASRFRALVNLYLCQDCYVAWWHTGELPGADLAIDQVDDVRW